MLHWLACRLLFGDDFQFSIRALLLLTLAVALPCGWLAAERNDAARRREVAERIERLGGATSLQPPWGPTWLWQPFGFYFFTTITMVSLDGAAAGDADLAYLSRLPELRRLNLADEPITDAGLEHLKGLTKLRALDLSGTKITDTGLKHLRGLPELQILSLDGTQITDAGLQHLEGLSALQNLQLDDTRVGDAGLDHLKGLANLTWLGLHGTRTTAAGLTQPQRLEETPARGPQLGARQRQEAKPRLEGLADVRRRTVT